MRIDRRIEVEATPQEVWQFLWQVERLAKCLPGCQEVRTITPQKEYEVRIQESVGPFKAQFTFDAKVLELQPERLVRVLATGKDSKLGATARGELLVTLTGNAGKGTILDITADIQMTGKVATLGQVAIKRKADSIMTQFAEQLRQQLQPTRQRGGDA